VASIKFNKLTKEIELKGSESFIEANFNKIQELLVESFGETKMPMSRKTKTIPKTISLLQRKESSGPTEIKRPESPEIPQLSIAAASSVPEISQDLKPKRAPLRKYIRQVGIPGQQKMVVEVAEQKQEEISITSLKEKFGLSESKIGEIIRDAEKLGKVRRTQNGSYVWTQD